MHGRCPHACMHACVRVCQACPPCLVPTLRGRDRRHGRRAGAKARAPATCSTCSALQAPRRPHSPGAADARELSACLAREHRGVGALGVQGAAAQAGVAGRDRAGGGGCGDVVAMLATPPSEPQEEEVPPQQPPLLHAVATPSSLPSCTCSQRGARARRRPVKRQDTHIRGGASEKQKADVASPRTNVSGTMAPHLELKACCVDGERQADASVVGPLIALGGADLAGEAERPGARGVNHVAGARGAVKRGYGATAGPRQAAASLADVGDSDVDCRGGAGLRAGQAPGQATHAADARATGEGSWHHGHEGEQQQHGRHPAAAA